MEELKIEIKQLADKLKEETIKLKQNGTNIEMLNSTFRYVHTMKGGLASVGLKLCTAFFHKTENLVDYVRKNNDANVFQLMLESFDKCIEVSDKFYRSEENIEGLDNAIHKTLKDLESEIDFISKLKKIGVQEIELKNKRQELEISETESIVYKIDIVFEKTAEMKLVKCFMIETNLGEIGNVIAGNITDFKEDDEKNDLTITFQTFKRVSKEMVAEIADIGEIKSLKVIAVDSLINFYINKYNDSVDFIVVYSGKNSKNMEIIKKLGFEVETIEDIMEIEILNKNFFLILEAKKENLDKTLKFIKNELPYISFIVIIEDGDYQSFGKAVFYNSEAVYIGELDESVIGNEISYGIARTKRLMRY